MQGPKLNILIRTSGRPEYFKRLIANIGQQTYTNYRLIVSADSDDSEEYVREAGITPVRVERLERTAEETFPWNLYLNLLMDQVEDGWIMFMDDDDQYADQTAFQLISAHVANESKMVVWRMQFPDGRNVPAKEYWGQRPFTRRQIGMPCFAFHSRWKKYVRFDGNRAGDYRMANQLQQFLEVIWLGATLVQLGNFGNAGNREDLK